MNCPKCNGKLQVRQSIEADRYFNINKNGTISNKGIISENDIYVDIETLQCDNCNSQYDFELKNKKIIIGNEINFNKI